MPGRPVQREGLLVVIKRVGVAALALGHPAQGLVDAGLTRAVTKLPVQRQAVGKVGAGLAVIAEPGAG